MMVIEDCPTCGKKLECVRDEKGFVIDWHCGRCGISWTLEDLEFEPIQKNLGEWLK